MSESATPDSTSPNAEVTSPLLALRGICKEYYGTPVLKRVDLNLVRGEVHALLGENGAGKSTLMNILFGMPVIHSTGGFEGSIVLDGEPTEVGSPEIAMELGIGMVHQEFMLIPGFSIAENVKLNREPLNRGLLGRLLSRAVGTSLDTLDRTTIRIDTERALEHIELPIDPDTPVGGLPVGHLQFVEIAREIDKSAMKILVFDEPTAVLAETEAERLLKVMRGLADEGLAILFITHRLDEVMQVADRVTILRDGERVLTEPRSAITIERIAETMVGRKIEARKGVVTDEASETQDAILEFSDLHVDFPGEQLRGVDLAVRRGEILGIGGLAGQGKIGIANGIMGLFPARGDVLFEGEKLPLGDPKRARAAGLAFVSEDRRGTGLLLDEPIEMNIAIPAMEVSGQFLKTLHPRLQQFALVDRGAVRRHAEQAISELDIRTTGPDQPVRRLSGGNQQKVCLAAALATDPKLLFVSEPTRGIDIGAKQLVLDRLVELNARGLTIVMTSSELGELRSICQRIAIIAEGKVAGVLPKDAPDVEFGLLMSGESTGDVA